MPFSNLQLMRESRRDLAPHWGLGVLVAFVYILIVGIPSNIFPDGEGLVSLMLAGPLSVGLLIFLYLSVEVKHHIFFSFSRDLMFLEKVF